MARTPETPLKNERQVREACFPQGSDAKKAKRTVGRGLFLLLMPTGAKYWRFRYRMDGKAKELALGQPWPDTSLVEARALADELRTQVAKGIDPAEVRKQDVINRHEAAAHTFREAADAWFEFRSAAWARRTSEQVREYLDKDLLPKLGRRPLASITTNELAMFTRKLANRGAPDVAKKARQWIGSIYSYARGSGWTTADPVRDLGSVTLPSQGATNYPHLAIADLPDFLRKLDACSGSPMVKNALRLSLWTANRPGVTRTIRWSELDLDKALWLIDKDREGMKRGYRHSTPLPTQAVAMLRDLQAVGGKFEHVFIGRNDPRKSISDGSVNGLLKRLGFRGKQTMHGFRHLISTALNEQGYNRDWIERQLAHGDPDKIRGTYNKAAYLEQRAEMMQWWADQLDSMRGSVRPDQASAA